MVIALSHDLPHRYGVEAARAGQHILMEIPVAAMAEEAEEVLAATQGAGGHCLSCTRCASGDHIST